MLVQYRHDGRLRLFRQHHHALVSGELAGAWRGISWEPESLPFDLVLATALHDLAWRGLDREPRLDPESRRPFAFHEHPLDEKLAAYKEGLDEVAAIHPYAALLGSLHYTSFPDVRSAEGFQAAEGKRRAALERELEIGPEERATVDRQLAFLRLFDSLSIFLCLTPPSASTEEQPSWVQGAHHLEVPSGGTFHLTWVDDEVVHVDPFPFRETLELRFPYRQLAKDRFSSPRELRRAWEGSPERVWWVSVRSALRLA